MPADPGPVIAALEAAASAKVRDEMAPRYGIVTDQAFGVPMAAMQRIAKPLAPDHALPPRSGTPAGTRPAPSPA